MMALCFQPWSEVYYQDEEPWLWIGQAHWHMFLLRLSGATGLSKADDMCCVDANGKHVVRKTCSPLDV